MGQSLIKPFHATLVEPLAGREKTERLELEVSRCVNEVVFSASNVIDSTMTDAGRHEYAANPSADNSYSNDQYENPPSQPMTPVGTQSNRWSAVPSFPPPSTMQSEQYGSPSSPRGQEFSNNPVVEDHAEAAYARNSPADIYPMPTSHVQERPTGPVSDMPPSINVSFSSPDINPYSSPGQPPLVVTNMPTGEDPWNRQAPHVVRTEPEEDNSHERAVHFQSPVQEHPFPEPNIPGHQDEDHTEGEAELWIRKHREY